MITPPFLDDIDDSMGVSKAGGALAFETSPAASYRGGDRYQVPRIVLGPTRQWRANRRDPFLPAWSAKARGHAFFNRPAVTSASASATAAMASSSESTLSVSISASYPS